MFRSRERSEGQRLRLPHCLRHHSLKAMRAEATLGQYMQYLAETCVCSVGLGKDLEILESQALPSDASVAKSVPRCVKQTTGRFSIFSPNWTFVLQPVSQSAAGWSCPNLPCSSRHLRLTARLSFECSAKRFGSSTKAVGSCSLGKAVKDDWYGKLSGGQRSKAWRFGPCRVEYKRFMPQAELVRQIFLQQQCPQILLIDEAGERAFGLCRDAPESILDSIREALGPLDAQSKVLVQRKLKAWELYGLACCY